MFGHFLLCLSGFALSFAEAKAEIESAQVNPINWVQSFDTILGVSSKARFPIGHTVHNRQGESHEGDAEQNRGYLLLLAVLVLESCVRSVQERTAVTQASPE